MRSSFRALTCIAALAAAITGVNVAPVVAQTTVEPSGTTAPAARHHRQRRVLHPGIGSAASRNVGPSSTIGGVSNTEGGGRAGVPDVAGAPGAGPTNGGGGGGK